MVLACSLSPAAAAPVPIDPSVLEAEQTMVEAIGRATPSTVAIFAGDSGGGSGVLLTRDGYAVTNFHVVQPAGVAMTCGLPDGHLYDAVLVGVDPTGDLALIKLLGRDEFPCAAVANSDGVEVGDACFTAGNPFLLGTDLQPSISVGIVSGVHRYQFPAGTILEYTDCLQVDAAINPGNSGGGLFDAEGRLIGINGRASFEKRGRVNVGVGYAISTNQLRHFMGVLRAGRICDHATLGATVATSADGRVVVSDILESSDAWRRGLRYDDEIVSLAGRAVRTGNAFKNVLGTLPAGWQVPVVIRSGGRRRELVVRLASVHSAADLKGLAAEPEPEGRRPDPTPRELPAAVRGLVEQRQGFANAHFNRVERDRVAASIAAARDAGPTGPWLLEGRLGTGEAFRIELTDHAATIDIPTGTSTLVTSDDFDRQPVPPGSGGLLPALVLWRRLVLEGPAALGHTIYWGTAPRDPTAFQVGTPSDMVDVLESSVSGVELHTFIDGSGRVVAVDLWTQPGTDPCEVRMAWAEGAPLGSLPTRIEARRGGDEFATFLIGPVPAEMGP